MNKRQAKKNFKKKYGVNPAKFEKQKELSVEQISRMMERDWQEFGRKMADVVKDVCDVISEGMKNISDLMKTPEFKSALEQYRKENEGNQDEQVSE